MAKLYERVNWEDLPSKNTPINAENLNKMDKAIDDLDDKIVELEEGGGSGSGADVEYLEKEIGELENLSTNSKENLVEAINEVFQSVSDGKVKIASAITDKSIVTPSDATFDIMADNIRNISTGEYKYISVREIGSLYLNKYDNTGDAYKTSLTIDGSNSWYYRGILQHDISMVPKGSTIISAKLLMYAFTGNDNCKNSRCYVSRVTSPWDDTTIWSTQPTYEEYVNHKQTPNVDVASGIPMWCEVDITDIVKQWVENDNPNYGVMIRAIEEGGYRNNWDVYTRHYNNGEYASYINVVYIVN